MQTGLRLLKDNAVLAKVNDPKPYYQISMSSKSSETPGSEERCTIQIAATKPLRDPITTHPLHPDYEEVKPENWVVVKHNKGDDCGCPEWAKKARSVYDTWQKIHLTLRHKKHHDRAAFAFYPEFEYDIGEALGHASLVASLALTTQIPECYYPLAGKYGNEDLKTLVEGMGVCHDSAFDSEEDERGTKGEEGENEEEFYDHEYESDGPVYNDDSDEEIIQRQVVFRRR